MLETPQCIPSPDSNESSPSVKVPRSRESILSKQRIRKPTTTKRLYIKSILKNSNRSFTRSMASRRAVTFNDTMDIIRFKAFPDRICEQSSPQKCTKCDNSYPTKRALNIHMSSHIKKAIQQKKRENYYKKLKKKVAQSF